MTPEEKLKHERIQLERDLKERGVIRMSLDQEIKDAENFIREYAREQERDPRAESAALEDKRLKAISLKFADDMLLLIRNPAFRRICWSIFEECGMFKLSYRRGDTHASALMEGRRSVALDLMSRMMTVDPGIFIQMQREHISDLKSQGGNNA